MQKLRRNIALLFISRGFGTLHFDRGIFMLYLLHVGLSDMEISAVQICIFLLIVVFEVPSGLFADTFGRRASLIVSTAMLCLYAIGMIFAEDFWLFFILFGIAGIGFALTSGADTAMLYDTLKDLKRSEEFTKINSRLLVVSNLAFAFAIFIGGYMQEYGGWTLVYSSYFAVLFISGLAACFMIEPSNGHESNETPPSYTETFQTLTSIFSHHKFSRILWFILAMALFEAAIVPLYIYGQKLFLERGYDPSEIGIIYGIVELVAALCFLLAPYILTKLQAMHALMLAIALSAPFILSLAIESRVIPVLAFVLMFSLPEARRPIEQTYFNDRIPSEIRASLISVSSMLGALLIALSYGFYAWAQNYWSIGIVMAITVIICPISIVLLLIYQRNPLPKIDPESEG